MEAKCVAVSDGYDFDTFYLTFIGTGQSQRTLQTPQTMAWAVRQRSEPSSTTRASSSTTGTPAVSLPASTGAGLMYIDPSTLRRTATATTTVHVTTPAEAPTMTTTASQLARCFGNYHYKYTVLQRNSILNAMYEWSMLIFILFLVEIIRFFA